MKFLRKSPFLWLIVTGVVASIALVVEAGLPVSRDIHFLLEFLWVGVVSAALLAFVMAPVLSNPKLTTFPAAPVPELREPAVYGEVTEWYDEDRLWLQGHVGSELTQD
jgi:hypothetical protein